MPRRTGSRSTRGRASAPAGVLDLFMRPQRSLPIRILGLLIRLRAEITLLAVSITVWVWLSAHLPRWAVITVLVTFVVIVLAVPVSRRLVIRRFWCVLSRHRMRAALNKSRHAAMTYDGKLPYILWSRPTPVGERLRVWLPAGLSVKELERSIDTIAVACFARTARVVLVRSLAALVLIDIVRRDPLSGAALVDTADDIEPDDDELGELIPLPRRQLPAGEPDDGNDETAAAPPASRRSKGHGTATSAAIPSARGVGGMDVSDYV